MKQHFLLWLFAIILLTGCTPSDSVDDYVQFLYENMSMPDSVDYSRDFYTEQAHLALKARAELPWGSSVPEREFRHFVLPPRVSNEDMDHFRATYYEELRNRVGQLSMQEAILEVNHWCHEHVTYRPTSARTLGPESTLRTAYGRCGEESVLLVAALRTVGIPARQVYTPRWAHTDDNHAWVEAWADGQWYFLGACEPEPILNLGWFNESASRGMLMHTKVFGNYDGPEEVVSRQPGLTEINVTDIYAPTRRLTVTVLDSLDTPVADATVEFKLYNYAEFYTVAHKQTDANGQASLTAGLGDMLVWATAPAASSSASSLGEAHICASSLLAIQKVSFATDSLVTLHLAPAATALPLAIPKDDLRGSVTVPEGSVTVPEGSPEGLPLDITPPAVSTSLPSVTPEQRAENNRRLAIEDSIRHAYEATMPDQRSRGNHTVITAFRDSAVALGQADLAEQLITTLPDKDLQDVTIDVLMDNLLTALPDSPLSNRAFVGLPDEISLPYLHSPRIERERLTAFKTPLRSALLPLIKGTSGTSEATEASGASMASEATEVSMASEASDATEATETSVSLIAPLIAWIRDSIAIVEGHNPQRLRMTPLGVYRARMADHLGRDIFFVAACRALGIPARINEINGKVQYYGISATPSPSSAFMWNDVSFDAPTSVTTPAASVPVPEGSITVPEGSVTVPEGTVTVPEGSITVPEGSITVPEGSVTVPEGPVTVPEGSPSGLPSTLHPASTGTLRLTYTPAPHLPDAKYYTHFTLSRLDEDNRLQLLTYSEEATFQNTFRSGVTLDAGTYVLTTGIRMASGSVRALLQAFDIQPGSTVTVPLTLRTATDAVAVIGSLNAEELYQPIAYLKTQTSNLKSNTDSILASTSNSISTSGSHSASQSASPSASRSGVAHICAPPTSLLATCGRGYYALGLIAPYQEPTSHALRDITLVSNDLETWNRKLVLLFEDADAAARFNFSEFSNLPSTTVWGCDINGTIKQEIMEQMHLSNGSLPIFLICDSFNRVVFVQQGYTIGLGEQLLKVIHQI